MATLRIRPGLRRVAPAPADVRPTAGPWRHPWRCGRLCAAGWPVLAGAAGSCAVGRRWASRGRGGAVAERPSTSPDPGRSVR